MLSSTLLPLLALASLASASESAVNRQRHRQLSRSLAATSNQSDKRQARTSGSASSQAGIESNAPLGGYKIVGDSGVSAQMMFLGTENTVFILDKTENNSMQVTTPEGVTRPAWGTSYDLSTNVATPMSVTSNTFCAGGFSLANGSWAIFGGNQPVTYQGVAVNDKGQNPSGDNPYGNSAGGEAIRLLTPCDDGQCEYLEGGAALTMTGKRWYPTIEGLADGSVIVLGGDENGGYVSTYVQNNPSYEFWPKSTGSIHMDFLNATVPLNLFPLTWLMPSGKLFMQASYSTIMYDLNTRVETPLPDMPYAVRVYPASAATVMLPLTPANNYNPTLLFCGGSSAPMEKSSDGGAGFNVTSYVADDSCVRITPESDNPVYEDDDRLPEPRSMGQFIYLPDGTMWMGNGVRMGTAGYGDENFSFGQSYGQDPLYMPAIYDPNAPSGSRFSRTGLSASEQERMYHSSAILLGDGSILVSGSNPNKDVTNVRWGTSYEVEKFYPLWYNKPRPQPSAFPSSLTYGGAYWNVTYTPQDTTSDPGNTKVVIIRTGFSTHGMNMGQRYLELATSYTKLEETGEVTLHVSQMPPNANIFQPGPAMMFLVVDGVPSIGKLIVIGSGKIQEQPMLAASTLPGSAVIVVGQTASNESTESITAASGPAATAQAAIGKSGASAGLSVSSLFLGAFALVAALHQ